MVEVNTNGKEKSNESAIGAFLFLATGIITGAFVAYAVMKITETFIPIHESTLIYSLAEAGTAVLSILFYMMVFFYCYRCFID